MKASLIVAAYNVAQWAEECILSVRSQTFRDFECIVVDDGSDDGTDGIIESAAAGDPRFCIVRQVHSGLSAARNFGLSKASGEYIQWIDADDFLKPECLQKTAAFMDEGRLDIALFDAENVNSGIDELNFHKEMCYFIRIAELPSLSTGAEMFCRMMEAENFIYAVFLQAIRRDRIEGQFIDGIPAEDLPYTVQNLLVQNRAGYLPEKLYCKRTRDGSAVNSSLTFEKVFGSWKAVQCILEWIDGEGIASRIGRRPMEWLERWLDRTALRINMNWRRLGERERNKFNSLSFKDRWNFKQTAFQNMYGGMEWQTPYMQKAR